MRRAMPPMWTAPASWTAKPAGAMRKGSYAIKGDDGQHVAVLEAHVGGRHGRGQRLAGSG